MKRETKKTAPSDAPVPMDPSVREEKNPVAKPNTQRACYGIKQLAKEVEALFPETTYEVSNYDGRNTGLDVTFAVHESPGLAELLTLTEADPRVAEVIEDDGSVLVAFVPNPRTQDLRDPFGLAETWDILAEQMDYGQMDYGQMEVGSW